MSHKEIIQKEMEPLIADAKTTGKWLQSTHGNHLFAPEELVEHQKNDHYLWGKVNWKLRDPEEYLQDLKKQRDQLDEKIATLEERIEKYG